MSVEIIPNDAVLGAEIRGVDLARPLDDATFCEIERAFNRLRKKALPEPASI